ncbi:MAG: hypothetical protein LBV80_07810 [Deltaproteobacteria bacterium]|jgi:lambda family phage tail tape measure protein|nr:hypothetical protein [Deltaproteobacteria bacterium]
MPVFYATLDPTGVQDGAGKAIYAINGVGNSMDGMQRTGVKASTSVERSLNNLARTARNVIGAYISLRGAMSAINAGFGYNEMLQSAQIGIASVLTQTQKIEDSQGRLLDGQEKFNAAMSISKDVAKSVDAATMRAAASYEQLLSALQTSLAPAAGMNKSWEETLGLVSTMSNAMSALGADLNGLDREMARWMTGRDFTNSQIARTLNISAADVKLWREQGVLFEKMGEALGKFNLGAKAAAESFRNVKQDMIGSLQAFAGEATTGMFDKTTQAMKNLSLAFYSIEFDETGKAVFVLNEQMRPLLELSQDIADALGDGLLAAVEGLKSGLRELGEFYRDHKEGMQQIGAAIKTIISNLDTLIEAYIIYKGVLSVTSGSLGHQKTLLQGSIKQFGLLKTAMTALSGIWPLAIGAGIAILYEMATAQTEGQKVMSKYNDEIAAMKKGGEAAADSLKALKESVEKLSKAELDAAMVKARLELEAMYQEADRQQSAWLFKGGLAEQSGKIKNEFNDLLEQFRHGQLTLDQFKEKASAALVQLGDKDAQAAYDKVMDIAAGIEFAQQRMITYREALQNMKGLFGFSEEKKPDNPQIAAQKAEEAARQKAIAETNKLYAETEQAKKAELEAAVAVSAANYERLKSTDEATRALAVLTKARKDLADFEGKGGSGDKGLESLERVAYQTAEVLKEADDALTGLTMRTAELQSELSGETLEATFLKIERQFEAQRNRVAEQQRKLDEDARRWAKDGKLDAETLANITATREKLRLEMEELEIQKQLEIVLAKRADTERELQAGMDYEGLIGNLREQYRLEAKLLRIQQERASGAEKDALRERERVAQARADLDIGGMFETGMKNLSNSAQQGYIDFYEKTLPDAIGSSSDAFADFFSSIGTGQKSASEAFKDLGRTFSDLANQVISDFIRMQMRMALFGEQGGGGGGMGGLFGMIGSAFSGAMSQVPSLLPKAKGDIFPGSSGLDAYRNSIVTSPTAFAFARGAAFGNLGVMGEKPGSPGEAIIPLSRMSGGDLGVKAALAAPAPNVQMFVNIENNAQAEVETRQTMDASGRPGLEIFIKPISEAIAGDITTGRGPVGKAINKAYGMNRANSAYHR